MVSAKAVLISGITCMAVAGAATIYWQYGRRTSNPAKAKAKSKARRKDRPANAAVSEAVAIPSESDFIGQLLSSMERMQSTGSVSSAKEEQLAKVVEAASGSPGDFSVRCRLMAAQWMILYQTLISVSAEAPVDLSAHQRAMTMAWALLDISQTGLSAEERSAADILQLDVSQRLRSASLMVPVYERLMKRLASSSISNEETLVLFTSAPLLGRWQDTRLIGDKILAQQQSLDDFHQAALQRPELPDYSVLYDQAVKRKSPDQTDISWTTYSIEELRIRLRDVQASDRNKVNEIRSSISPDWQLTGVSPESRVFHHGAIGQMTSISEVRISCVGPWDNGSVDLHGWADLHKGPNPSDGRVRQSERYQFSCEGSDTDGKWSGTYTLTQIDQGETLQVEFDLEIVLKIDKALSPPSN